jgi:DNA repair photolyase
MFGISNSGEPGFSYEWINRLEFINVIISRTVSTTNKYFLDRLIENKDNMILHICVSGWGGTSFEPKIPKVDKVLEGVEYLKKNGFNTEFMVLRIDPIFPNSKGLNKVTEILELFKRTGIVRVRYGILRQTNTVRQRFIERFGKCPFSWEIPNEEIVEMVDEKIKSFGYYTYESCRTGLPDSLGCVSEKDLRLFGMTGAPYTYEKKNHCKCLSGTVELMDGKCPGGCVYCYLD